MDESEKKYEFTWRIENFSPCLHEIGNEIINADCIESPDFLFYIGGYTQWYIRLYPITGRNNAFIKCLPICREPGKDYSINCELSILGNNNSAYATKKIKCKCSALFHCDFSNALEIERSKLPNQSDLIMRCVLSFTESDIENMITNNDVKKLSQDMLNLYTNRQHSDLTLCIGRYKLPVHRTIICIRAPKWAEFLKIQDVESFKSVIEVENISFSALKILITYLYTGEIDQSLDDLLPEMCKIANIYNLVHLKYEILPEETHSTACTRINSFKQLFNWQIDSFSTLNNTLFKMIDLKLSRFILSLSPSDNFQLCFKIISLPESKKVYLRCKISVLDKAGNLALTSNHMHRFEWKGKPDNTGEDSTEKWHVPALLNKNDILLNKDVYLSNESLNLQMELEITEGEKMCEITERKSILKVNNSKISHFAYLSKDFLDVFNIVNGICMVGDYYYGGWYEDAILEVDKKEILCHKSILCARSPFFSQLFTSKVKSEPEKIKISGVDHGIILSMLQYVYSGILTDLGVVETAKLYIAASKYQVSALTEKCSFILEKSMTVQNLCDILLFSHKRKTCKQLINFVFDYIRCNKATILKSTEWKEFAEKNPTICNRIIE